MGLRGLRRAGEHLRDPVHSGAGRVAQVTLRQGTQVSAHAGLRALGICVLLEVHWKCASCDAQRDPHTSHRALLLLWKVRGRRKRKLSREIILGLLMAVTEFDTRAGGRIHRICSWLNC